MIVYGVGIHYEGIVEVFSTHEKAEAYIVENGGYDFYYIENMEVR